MTQDKTNWSKGYLRTDEVFGSPVDLSEYTQEGASWLDERAVECLGEMANICNEEGIGLILFKSPRYGWYQYFTIEIEALAKEYGISYIDYNALAEEIIKFD